MVSESDVESALDLDVPAAVGEEGLAEPPVPRLLEAHDVFDQVFKHFMSGDQVRRFCCQKHGFGYPSLAVGPCSASYGPQHAGGADSVSRGFPSL